MKWHMPYICLPFFCTSPHFLPLIMASNSITLPFFLFLFHFLLPAYSDEFPTVIATGSEDKNRHGKEEGINIDIEAIASAISDKGYLSMALTLRLALESNLIPPRVSDNNSRVTIFCPPNRAFLESRSPDRTPLALLQYHISPSELRREALESSPGANAKVNTLLSGHSLVITTEPGSGEASINEVKITEWDVYNDGSATVHGVEDFLDPTFQALPHAWHHDDDDEDDDEVIKNEEVGLSQKEDLMRMLLYAVIVAIFLGYPQAGLLLIIIWLFMPSRFCTCRP